MKFDARRLAAPLSVAVLALAAGFAIVQVVGPHPSEYPPPILDPEFDLWVSDSVLGGRKLLVWEVTYFKDAGDTVALEKTQMDEKSALGISVYQDGTDERGVYIYLTQEIDGTRLRALMTEEVGVWVFYEQSSTCNDYSTCSPTIFGIETNDGRNTLTFVFSTETRKAQQFLAHRMVFVSTPRGEWINHAIAIAEQYEEAEWNYPDRVSFSIVLWAPATDPGWHRGYVHRFTVTAKTPVGSAQTDDITRDNATAMRTRDESMAPWFTDALIVRGARTHILM